MPNHTKPIDECDVWDILDWNCVEALASEATGDPRDRGNLWPWIAKELLTAGSKSDHAAAQELHRIASPVIGYGEDAARRQKAGLIAEAFGAEPGRLIDYLAFKWGLFKRS